MNVPKLLLFQDVKMHPRIWLKSLPATLAALTLANVKLITKPELTVTKNRSFPNVVLSGARMVYVSSTHGMGRSQNAKRIIMSGVIMMIPSARKVHEARSVNARSTMTTSAGIIGAQKLLLQLVNVLMKVIAKVILAKVNLHFQNVVPSDAKMANASLTHGMRKSQNATSIIMSGAITMTPSASKAPQGRLVSAWFTTNTSAGIFGVQNSPTCRLPQRPDQRTTTNGHKHAKISP
mmetsp:Transcript_8198/g.15021  ORF Transcript_8198/g.15021 Transcript_8198/m.15021 type:complete len:235 (+) Transcript_8198:263-967(+)